MTTARTKNTHLNAPGRKSPDDANAARRSRPTREPAKGPEAKRRLILDAARSLFIREGYENVSLRRIARRTGYSPAALYRYFESKDAILRELRREGRELFHERQLRTLAIVSPRERLLTQGRDYLAFAQEQPEYFELLFGTVHDALGSGGTTASAADGAAAAPHSRCGDDPRLFELFERSVHEAMASRDRPQEDPDAMVFTLWSMVHGLACLTSRGRLAPHCTGCDPSTLLERMCAVVLGPGSAEPPGGPDGMRQREEPDDLQGSGAPSDPDG